MTTQDLRYGGTFTSKTVTAPRCIGRYRGQITTDQTAYDVTQYSCSTLNTGAGSFSMHGLSGGIEGQEMSFFKITNDANTVTFVHQSVTGTQVFNLEASVDKVLTIGYPGIRFRLIDGEWREIVL